jgi:hypothetical protein
MGADARLPLLIGEHNPYGDPGFALYPSPRGCAGWRLCHTILQMDPDDYCDRFRRMNLCHGAKWSMKEARSRALDVVVDARDGETIILCGAKVARAFRLEPATADTPCRVRPMASVPGVPPWDLLGPRPPARRYTVVVLPHPSGLCRLWHKPGVTDTVRRTLSDLLPTAHHDAEPDDDDAAPPENRE